MVFQVREQRLGLGHVRIAEGMRRRVRHLRWTAVQKRVVHAERSAFPSQYAEQEPVELIRAAVVEVVAVGTHGRNDIEEEQHAVVAVRMKPLKLPNGLQERG